jgi:hypothetical protein
MSAPGTYQRQLAIGEEKGREAHRVVADFVDVIQDISWNETNTSAYPSLETVHHLLDLGVVVHDLNVELNIFGVSIVLHPVPVIERRRGEVREGEGTKRMRCTELLIRKQGSLSFLREWSCSFMSLFSCSRSKMRCSKIACS